MWSASFPLTPYRGVLNRLSIAHCKALGESCLLSHKSSSWGVVGRSYGRQKKMANGTMKMVKASLKGPFFAFDPSKVPERTAKQTGSRFHDGEGCFKDLLWAMGERQKVSTSSLQI